MTLGRAGSAGPWVDLVAAAPIGGTVNAARHSVGFRLTRDDHMVLTRAHPDFGRAVAAATVETIPSAGRRGARP